MFYFLQSTLSPSLRAKRGNPTPPPVIASEVKQSSTPGIKFGGHFHLPDSSEVKFGGHSCIIDLPDTQIWAHSCIIDLSDTLIWGSFLLHRPVRASNLGVKIRGSKRGGVRFFSFSKNFSPITFPATKKTEGLRRSVFPFFLTSNLSRSASL